MEWDTQKLEKDLGDLEGLLQDTICLIDEYEEENLSFVKLADQMKSFCAQRNLSYGKFMQLMRFATTNLSVSSNEWNFYKRLLIFNSPNF